MTRFHEGKPHVLDEGADVRAALGRILAAVDFAHEVLPHRLDVIGRVAQAAMLGQDRGEFVSESLLPDALAILDSPVGVAHAPVIADTNN